MELEVGKRGRGKACGAPCRATFTRHYLYLFTRGPYADHRSRFSTGRLRDKIHSSWRRICSYTRSMSALLRPIGRLQAGRPRKLARAFT